MKKYILADRFFLKNLTERHGYLAIENGKFGLFYNEKPADADETNTLNYEGKWIAPGLVDTHIHGLLGHDVMDNRIDALESISKGLLACGVTSFLPTTLTASKETLNAVVKTIGEHYKKVTGAKIQGIFLEGPFFTEKHKGAQNTNYFSDPKIETLQKWQELSGGIIKKIAIAAERKGVPEFTEQATASGIKVALSHSDATYEEAKKAVEAGATIFVHTYNGMSPLHHREPGMVGAALTLDHVFAELICDGHHVHPVAAEILLQAKKSDHVALVTDCMRAGAMPDGEYFLGEFPVKVQEGVAKLHSGSLAGSILKLKDAIKNVVSWGIASPDEAIRMASLTPAASAGLEAECGSISPGLDADFIVLTPELDLLETFLDGERRFLTEANEA